MTYLPDPEFCKSLDNFLHRFRLDICEPLCGLLLLEEKTPRMKYNTSFSSLQKGRLDTKDGFLARFASAEALICPRRLRATTSPPFCTAQVVPRLLLRLHTQRPVQWAAGSTAHQSAPGAKCLKTGNSFFVKEITQLDENMILALGQGLTGGCRVVLNGGFVEIGWRGR